MRKFELALRPAKTWLIRLGRQLAKRRENLVEGKPEPFDEQVRLAARDALKPLLRSSPMPRQGPELLGFTRCCSRSRKWRSFVIGRKTIQKRMHRRLEHPACWQRRDGRLEAP
jgi:RNA-directed DNA polymerase